MNKNDYLKEEKQRVKKLFAKKHKQGFKDKNDLANWFVEKIKEQDYKCEYCETSIFDIIKLIKNKKLKPRKTGYGRRGLVLEIDRKDNSNGYNRDNCVLACYYCNNDKSYILNSDDYKKYFGKARNDFFKDLLKE